VFRTIRRKRSRVVISEHLLGMFRKGKKSFMDRYVTIDETWVHDYDPETKVQSKKW
jgi:archaeosine-15-forming tRNA-guanine transglycosylase